MIVATVGVGLIGIGIRGGDPLGVLVDERNRYSLSRLQLFAWSILVLAALWAAISSNLDRGVNADEAFNVGIPREVLALMGIAGLSFAGASVVKASKASPVAGAGDQGGGDGDVTPLAAARKKADDDKRKAKRKFHTANKLSIANRPAIADLVQAERPSNNQLVDMGKVQVLFITAVVLVGYGLLVGDALNEVTRRGAFAELPVVNEGIAALLAISHATYVTYKAATTN